MTPKAHHFIGAGPISEQLLKSASKPETLVSLVSDIIRDCGLSIISEHSAGFEGGGTTLVWILAESHLVLHLWVPERFATVDLHICDFTTSNVEAAARLKRHLSELCFPGGQSTWQELRLEQPSYAPVA